jgi:hypothetical protein
MDRRATFSVRFMSREAHDWNRLDLPLELLRADDGAAMSHAVGPDSAAVALKPMSI